ncbi:MAG TPA: DUF481 domain-containing protein [Parafilimonas sp.]|nr:DUF481 domain-containing protein [Parafilimonas sp.]
MKKLMLLSLVPVLMHKAFSQEQKDTIFFTNGTMVIGEVNKIKLGVISFDPDDANDITVQLRKLKTIAATSKLFRIETVGNHVFHGKLIPYRINNYAQLVSDVDTILLFLQDISVMYPYDKRFIQRFSGNVGLGYSYTRSSDFGRLNFDGTVRYVSDESELSLSTSGIYTMTDSSVTRDNESFALKDNYYFSPTWFGTAFLAYQRNLELGLDRRFQEGLGAGNKFIRSKHVYAWARTGFVFNQEKSSEDIQTGTLTEIFGQLQFNLFRFTKPEINFDMSQTFYYNLSQNGRFRNDGEMNLNWEIIDDLNLNLGFYNNYDNQPPVEGSRKLDFGVVFGINYSF